MQEYLYCYILPNCSSNGWYDLHFHQQYMRTHILTSVCTLKLTFLYWWLRNGISLHLASSEVGHLFRYLLHFDGFVYVNHLLISLPHFSIEMCFVLRFCFFFLRNLYIVGFLALADYMKWKCLSFFLHLIIWYIEVCLFSLKCCQFFILCCRVWVFSVLFKTSSIAQG